MTSCQLGSTCSECSAGSRSDGLGDGSGEHVVVSSERRERGLGLIEGESATVLDRGRDGKSYLLGALAVSGHSISGGDVM